MKLNFTFFLTVIAILPYIVFLYVQAHSAPTVIAHPVYIHKKTENWALERINVKDIPSSTLYSPTIAIIDTGADINHPALKDSIWTNPGETGIDKNGKDMATNGIDDDKNGFIDDVHGWNFVLNNNDLTDHHGHGTHIAGIIGSTDPGVGVNKRVRLMILKFYDPKSPGRDNLHNTIKAIKYAVAMGAEVINYSNGGLDSSKDEFEAVKLAGTHNILFITAAGNEKSDISLKPYYPAYYLLPNIISVQSMDRNGAILESSNWGLSVDLAAPGSDIYSTLPGGMYGYMTGTSQATALTTGIASLVVSENPFAPVNILREKVIVLSKKTELLNNKNKNSSELRFDLEIFNKL